MYSGQLFDGHSVNTYIPYVEFDKVEYFDRYNNHWEEHYLGVHINTGKYITMYIKNQSRTKGPMI